MASVRLVRFPHISVPYRLGDTILSDSVSVYFTKSDNPSLALPNYSYLEFRRRELF